MGGLFEAGTSGEYLRRLKWGDSDNDNGMIKARKQGKYRYIYRVARLASSSSV